MFREMKRKNFIINERHVDAGSFRGAIVQDPVSEYSPNVQLYLDFASLYPSIMISFSLCFSTYIFSTDELEGGCFIADFPTDPTDTEAYAVFKAGVDAARRAGQTVVYAFTMDDGRRHHFVQEHAPASPNCGVLAPTLQNVLAARKVAKKAKKSAKDPLVAQVQDARQLSLKVVANSIYGFCGVAAGVMPLPHISETVTYLGRFLISMCAVAIPRRVPGCRLTYGDTDSVIVVSPTCDVDEGWRLGLEAERYLNEDVLPSYGKALVMECEEVCSPSLFLAKKRYALRAFESPGGEGHVQVKGLEIVRRDTFPFLVKLYKKAVDLIFGDIGPHGPAKTQHQARKDLVAMLTIEFGKVVAGSGDYSTADFAISKTLQAAERYKNPQAIVHVALAEKINREITEGTRSRAGGLFTGGDRVQYVIMKGSGPVGNRVKLLEDCESLRDVDTLHVLEQTRRALSKFLQFFMTSKTERAVFEQLRSTLFLRQNRQHSLLDEGERRAKMVRAVGECLAEEEGKSETQPVRAETQRKQKSILAWMAQKKA